MAYLEELLPEFRKGAKIRRKCWEDGRFRTHKGYKGICWKTEEIEADDWELYKKPINWDYVIKNKCLCWFWDKSYDFRKAIFLRGKEKDYFLDDRGIYWDYCRPVRRDEVTFYEDRKDE